MTMTIAVFFLVPLVFMGSSLAESFRGLIAEISTGLQENTIQTPSWIAGVPAIGGHLDQYWQTYASDKQQLLATLKNHSGLVSEWLILIGGSVGQGVIDIALGIVLAFFFFQRGPAVVTRIRNLIENFGGHRSVHLLNISVRTVIGVVYGILGTAFALAVLAAIGYWIAGVPGAPFLGLVTFILGIIPGGPPFILVPVTIWLFIEGHQAMGVFMILWSIAIITVFDVVIRPYLISMGSRMPLILVFLGIFGGVAAFGFIGLFIGPALLAIASSLIIQLSNRNTA
jgi:predicted PurR-regulated permease PerM